MNDKPTVQDILVNPEKALDDAYNKGVDDAIGMVKVYFSEKYPLHKHEDCQQIISSLSKLKSNGAKD